MSGTPFMPLWVADFLADTLELDAKQVGAYMLILMAMWGRDGRLPNDPAKLQRVARCGRDWPRVWAAIGHYFTVDGDQITQDRLRKELQNAVTKRRVSAQQFVHSKADKALKTNNVTLANATLLAPQPESYSESKKETPLPPLAGGEERSENSVVYLGRKQTKRDRQKTTMQQALDILSRRTDDHE
jgi:uncharacterized protein YdaU (DUF1376 family)